SVADCTHAAVYYKSCSVCGDKSDETFESGSPLGHSIVNNTDAKYLKSVADCTHAAVYYKSCSVCGDKSDETFESGSPLGHSLVNNTDAKYLKSAADCTHAAVYYKSCSRCGLASTTETFDGSALGHDYQWKSDEKSHWKECTRCHSLEAESESHTFEYLRTAEPTTTKEGLEEEVCKACGYKSGKTKIIEKLPNKEVVYDAPKTVTFTKADNFEGGTIVVAKTVETGTQLETAKKALDGVVVETKMVVFDFTAIKDGVNVQPSGKVKVTTELEHFSTYVLANVQKSPKGNDIDVIFLMAALLAVMGISVLAGVTYRKKRNNI
ncbi:MAG: hypothetical protein IKN39_00395, partial [Clostridia bacterium]|nr:hypothetical protein [Clostridia bacterium]